ncbi:MAG: hypothetical protein A2744_04650 [Candidatus Buchananbacteria bacterium RIFCSPHIGHO2_01_FULL_44_11]|uniref:Uncharacterized protein n=1 Tax=Candidatus Buchananbacteria bacterium RIFCSPHIGHO2_01_FULL_44_11 TaxID=1797535 RepID=A0A1G1Y1N7_9BACT|nr:MAG: hypothetical protein A2744_04650 [Candidatus Buchananbacteria bacterium RIFCSPHIGHO2_01_FULL_44_11]
MQKSTLPIVLMSTLALVLIFNQSQLGILRQIIVENTTEGIETGPVAGNGNVSGNSNSQPGIDLVALAKNFLPFGIPPVYGAELKVSFDDPVAAINVLAQYEQDTRPNKLTGEKLERYIKIGQSTACEFCCGATTMVFPDGSKACGCAHSAAMRGVVAYLLENTNMTDQQILGEANKWKAVFFPGPMTQKFAVANGLISPANASAQGLQQQVGGC